MKIAITGASGFIVSRICDVARSRGHGVITVGRSSGERRWDPMTGPAPLEGADVVIHLAGDPVASGRWTKAKMARIRDSRVVGTRNLVAGIRAAKPRALVCASATGYYGDRGDELLDETAAPGEGFLPQLTIDWEAATAPIADAGVRVALLRTGIVLSPAGGALEKLLPIFKLGGGGPLGSGMQWMSWITLDDHVRAMQHALFSEGMRGAANLTAPAPVRNAEFAATLGRVLGRPAVLPVPAFALELLYGEMARATLLAGQRVMPAALASAGFQFEEPTLEGALRRVLNRPD
jgi:uncharacterized protein (TIGR01777 family)